MPKKTKAGSAQTCVFIAAIVFCCAFFLPGQTDTTKLAKRDGKSPPTRTQSQQLRICNEIENIFVTTKVAAEMATTGGPIRDHTEATLGILTNSTVNGMGAPLNDSQYWISLQGILGDKASATAAAAVEGLDKRT